MAAIVDNLFNFVHERKNCWKTWFIYLNCQIISMYVIVLASNLVILHRIINLFSSNKGDWQLGPKRITSLELEYKLPKLQNKRKKNTWHVIKNDETEYAKGNKPLRRM